MLTTWRDIEAPGPPEARLNWRPPRAALSDGPPSSLADLSRALRNAGLVDNLAVRVPGATVLMPAGLRLARRFRQIVEEELQAAQIEEWEYPSVISSDAMRISQLMDVRGRLLFAVDDAELASGAGHSVLGPSGESAIYDHWRSLIRAEADLPLRMFQRTTYFRPAARGRHSGRGLFRPLEARDVYEVHQAYIDSGGARKGYGELFKTLQVILSRCQVPTLWSTRPRATNNSAVAEQSIAGDALVPVGSTVQLATAYLQGQRFSRIYDVGLGRGADRRHTHHVAASISRRTLFAHLLVALSVFGRLTTHPTMAATEVLVFARRDHETSHNPLSDGLVAALRDQGLRVEVRMCDGAAAFRRATAPVARLIAPVEILIVPGRDGDGRHRMIARRPDLWETALVGAADDMAHQVRAALQDVAAIHLHRVGQWAASRAVRASTASDAQDVLKARLVAVVPAQPTDSTAESIGRWGLGEVLGFAQAPDADNCVLTGEATAHVAVVAARI